MQLVGTMHVVTFLLALLGAGVSQAYPGGNNRDVARSVADGCAAGAQYWMIDNFTLLVYDWDNGGTMGTFGFRSFYSATNKTVDCMVENVDLAKLATSWSKCSGNPGTEFQFVLEDMGLTIKETWTCPESPG